jgi:hypothetical protein
MELIRGIFVKDRARTPFWKFFLTRTQDGTEFQNPFFLALVQLTPPLSN